MRMQGLGQDPRDILEQPAAGDMRQRMDLAGLHQRQQALHIDARRRHQRVDQQDSLVEQGGATQLPRSEEHTSELQSLMRISYAVFCLKKKKDNKPKLIA